MSALALKLNVRNPILYRTEDLNISSRKELYKKEGIKFYTGNLWIPDDLEYIEL